MNRRELIKQIALLTGTAVIGSEFFLSGCRTREDKVMGVFSEGEGLFFDELAETILPRTSTPGAKDAEVGKFMVKYATDCYDDAGIRNLQAGIQSIDKASEEMNKVSFMKATTAQREALLTKIDAEGKKQQADTTVKNQQPHYFTLMKQLVLLGFFTSKPGATQVLHYILVPGKYEGCIDLQPGQTSWA